MSTIPVTPASGDPTSTRKYPRWYATLFALDTLERFGFYGMQAILVLYAVAPKSRGGLGLPVADAASLFGAWIALFFLASLPGGWLGDRVLGSRRALLVGAVLSTIGYLFLATPGGWFTAIGLCLLAAGGGLYKPNHQAMLNLMYGNDIGRREAGISLMWTGVQTSALIAPLVTGFIGEKLSWNLAFVVAAAAMALTAVLVAMSTTQFGETGARPIRPLEDDVRRKVRNRTLVVAGVVAVLLIGAGIGGALSASMAIGLTGLLSLIFPIIGYRAVYRNKLLNTGDRRRLRGFLWVFLGAALFWMIIAHAGSLLNLFALNHVDREILGWTIPASWLMVATPAFMLVLAPFFAWWLPRLGRRDNVGVKFAIGLLLVGGSFLLMSVATLVALDGTKVSPLWLVAVYFAHACGELIVAAVTIAAAGDVLPRQFMGRTLGLLYLFAALGGGVGAGVVRLAEVVPEPLYYLGLGSAAALAGLAFAIGRRRLTRSLLPGSDEPDQAAAPEQEPPQRLAA
ncbi:oligopeptide:H+ symporter [Actinophytocola sp.]|uniref:peptide MFS transporter n=1 Tax=Actinophytocola sp. TaxID=1872138 RepID=UPI002D7ECAE4|nr:oligopeptide:H+ symporter [Actinophytocola sp.]HET9139714.1 oligopeptide:H+ symporter [Actinophytocola sp.]